MGTIIGLGILAGIIWLVSGRHHHHHDDHHHYDHHDHHHHH